VILATISEGHADGADILFLLAVVLFVVCAVVAALEKSVVTVLLSAGLAFTALAWLVL
jgi:NADH:ubiquinone oxidoreductase subunit K